MHGRRIINGEKRWWIYLIYLYMEMNLSENKPYISIVIPVYNEEAILRQSVLNLINSLDKTTYLYEIIMVENGSRDNTLSLARGLESEYPQKVRCLSVTEPNYGAALKIGILNARGTVVINDEIDIGDVDFYKRAMEILERGGVEMVVGSKLLSDSQDLRPWARRFASKVIKFLLKLFLGFKGTETHGLKAWKREKLENIVKKCVTDQDVFVSEMIVRAERGGIKIVEIPIKIEEKRTARIRLIKRVPSVLKNILKLAIILKLKP